MLVCSLSALMEYLVAVRGKTASVSPLFKHIYNICDYPPAIGFPLVNLINTRNYKKEHYLNIQILMPAAISSLMIGSMDFGESVQFPLMIELQIHIYAKEKSSLASLVNWGR